MDKKARGTMNKLKSRLVHAKDIAAWKLDQQRRTTEKQGEIRSIQSQVRMNKSLLSDRAYELFMDGALSDDQLVQICQTLRDLQDSMEICDSAIESIRHEAPPESEDWAPSEFQATSAKEEGNLVCPECGMSIRGKFCTIHGVEGVPEDSGKCVPSIEPEGNPGARLCPECGITLSQKYCPVHGTEGVVSTSISGDGE